VSVRKLPSFYNSICASNCDLWRSHFIIIIIIIIIVIIIILKEDCEGSFWSIVQV
jgi:hypothetical protein